MILYVNGCSHSAGHCVPLQRTYSNMVMSSLVKNYDMNPSLTFNKLPNNFLYNDAKHGAGNDFIFHKSIETISHLISLGKKPDYVIIQWSGPNRRLHSRYDGFVEFVNPWDSPELGVPFEPMASEHSLHFIYALQEFLKKNEIEYWFFNYMALDRSIKKLHTLPLIDFNRFIDFDNGEYLYEGLIDFFKSQNLCGDEMGHPNFEGNIRIAQKLVDVMGVKLINTDSLLNDKLI